MPFKYPKDACPHPGYSHEVIFGQETGDITCTGCGETFGPGEPEFAKLKAEAAQRVRDRTKKR